MCTCTCTCTHMYIYIYEKKKMVKKAQYDNFKGWTQHQLHIKKIAGMTLTETMKDYIHHHRKDPVKYPLGASKYAEWKSMFTTADDSLHLLVVKNHNDPVPNQLFQAATNFKKRGGRSGFLQSIKTLSDFNQKIVVGIYRVFLQISCNASANQMNVLLEVLKLIHLKNLKAQYPDEFNVIQPHVEDALITVPFCLAIWLAWVD